MSDLPASLSPRPIRATARRLLGSQSLRQSIAAAYGPAVAGAGLLLAVVLINVLAAGGFVDWTGFHPIPTGGTR